MTEKEAKTKWCPYHAQIASRFSQKLAELGEKDEAIKVLNASYCLTSDCFMWRWDREPYTNNGPTVTSSISGYCGLGGKP